MDSLPLKDIRVIHQCIQEIYSLHNLDSFGVNSLTILNRLVPSEYPVFTIMNHHASHVSAIVLPGYFPPSPEMQEVSQRRWHEHPIIQNILLALKTPVKISDFITQSELHQLEGLYQRYLRCWDV